MLVPRARSLLAESKGFASAYSRMYPDFVFGKDIIAGATPVFFYHRITGEVFRRHLEHLKRNGYRTLSADELYESLTDPALFDRKHVVLTFDDGLDHLYSVVYPLLREFRFTAVAYIVPRWVGKEGFVTWAQVREMHESGLVDFQSHSMSHSSIFTSPQIVDFFHPRYVRHLPWDIPAATLASGEENPRYGTPIYTWSSRLSDARCYVPDARLQKLCVSYVGKNGGTGFFKKPGWRYKLGRFSASVKAANGSVESYENDLQRQNSVKQEIELSKETIENQLSGKMVRHFAFPWHQSGEWAKKALLDAGYLTLAGGVAKEHRPAARRNNTFDVSRVNGDFLPTLPGVRRQRFWKIMLDKAARRLYSGMPY